MKARFIVIEGGEGSGKSSLVAALKQEFGTSVHLTREPGGSLHHPLGTRRADARGNARERQGLVP